MFPIRLCCACLLYLIIRMIADGNCKLTELTPLTSAIQQIGLRPSRPPTPPSLLLLFFIGSETDLNMMF